MSGEPTTIYEANMTLRLLATIGMVWCLFSTRASAQIKSPARDTLTVVDSLLVNDISAAFCASPARDGLTMGLPLVIVNDSIVRPASFKPAACDNNAAIPAGVRRIEFIRPKVAAKMYGPAARAGALSLWVRRERGTSR